MKRDHSNLPVVLAWSQIIFFLAITYSHIMINNTMRDDESVEVSSLPSSRSITLGSSAESNPPTGDLEQLSDEVASSSSSSSSLSSNKKKKSQKNKLVVLAFLLIAALVAVAISVGVRLIIELIY